MTATWHPYVCRGGLEKGMIWWHADIRTGKMWLGRAAWEDNVLYGESSECVTHVMPYTGQARPEPPAPQKPLHQRVIAALEDDEGAVPDSESWEETSPLERAFFMARAIAGLLARGQVITFAPCAGTQLECVTCYSTGEGLPCCAWPAKGDLARAVVELAGQYLGFSD